MLLTLTLVILLSAILMFFSDEFLGIVKKLAKIPGVKLLAPLLFFSYMLTILSNWAEKLLILIYRLMQFDVHLILAVLPLNAYGVAIAEIITLAMLTLVPVLIFQWAYRKSHYQAYEHTNFLFIVLFIGFSMILLVPPL